MNFIAKLFLKKYRTNNEIVRDKALTSLLTAKDVGLVCKITNEDSYKEINSIFVGLQKFNRTLWLMGYCDGNNVPFYCLQQLTADFFCNKDLNWYGKPEKVQIHDYMKREFDLLIDFTHDEEEPVRTILTLSNAKCIVGSNAFHEDLYDIYIDSPSVLSHKELLDQVQTYTQQLTGSNE